MKKITLVICSICLTMSCNNSVVDKPDNLITKDKMFDILYDISLIEAIKSQNIKGGLSSKEGSNYIYKKYKIDSIQFINSNKYYASNVEEYKKMFDKIKEKLNKETKEIELKIKKSQQKIPSTLPKPINPDTPRVN